MVRKERIFSEATGKFVSGAQEEAIKDGESRTGSLPSGFFRADDPLSDVTEKERKEMFKTYLSEKKEREAAQQAAEATAVTAEPPAPIEPLKATPEMPVIERGETTPTPTPEIDTTGFGQEEFFDIVAKGQVGEELSNQEKMFLAKTKAKLDAGQDLSSIFPGTTTATPGVSEQEQIQAQADIETLGEQARQRENERIDRTQERISFANEEERRATESIRKQTESLQNQTQRLRSLRGVGRSTATEEDILALERQGQALISDVERKAALERESIRMQEQGASTEDIASINEQISKIENGLDEKIATNIAEQKKVDAEIGATFSESLDNILGTLDVAGVDIGDYDDKATKALGYVSDSKGNPLKLDQNGDPIAPLSEEGFDVKISNFKDANDNTYVYKNGKLDSIITNTGNILKGEELQSQEVPAIVKESKDEKARRDFETQLRKEFNSRQEVKNFNTIRSSYLRMLKAKEASQRETGAGDIALIFSYMKMLDPTSVVREGEFATASNSGGVSSAITNLYNKAVTGQFLNNTQRKEFVELGKDILNAEKATLNGIEEQFANIADEAGLRKNFIIGDLQTSIPSQGGAEGLGTFKTSGGVEIDFDAITTPTATNEVDTFEADVDEFDNL